MIVARVNDLTTIQKKDARLMRNLRLQIGMDMPGFGKLVRLDSVNLAAREHDRVPWKSSELEAALPALVKHCRECLKQAELLAATLNSQPAGPAEESKI